ncbi:MAG TPA: 3-deoxy-manno-octulosonate cytidylyltransferase [Dongiaceae bacterium]|jgi:3-deoxy-manno-octulosonate cytidylyltransferase (CMP-KDO synthetase)|nr:3-deoxy-manno-octulosonate cytidylyltransferase [Dongiaceae bacterium]
MKNPAILIPARMSSTRLPGKPLAPIDGVPMVVQVARRAREAELGPIYVAAAEKEICDSVERHGFQAILTDPAHQSGSDRIVEALSHIDSSQEHDGIINLQGDLPTLDPHLIHAVWHLLAEGEADIGTLAAPITREAEKTDPNVVKAVAGFNPGQRTARALYFTRATAPSGEGPLYHHIGIYAYRREALHRFQALPPGVLEQRERLEQLRALEAGMRIDIALVETVPLGVDTPEDLARARQMLEHA